MAGLVLQLSHNNEWALVVWMNGLHAFMTSCDLQDLDEKGRRKRREKKRRYKNNRKQRRGGSSQQPVPHSQVSSVLYAIASTGRENFTMESFCVFI